MSTNQLKEVEAETQNEIDQILNEVEVLRKELNSQSGEISEVEGLPQEKVARPAAAPVAVNDQASLEPDREYNDENDIAEVVSADSLSDEDLMKEFHESFKSVEGEEAAEGMEGTLAELKEDTSVKTLLDQTFEDHAERTKEKESFVAKKETAISQATPSSGDSGSLTMVLNGSMTLKLKYEFAGQEVTVGFTDEFFHIELADGTEFKVPVGRKNVLRRVA